VKDELQRLRQRLEIVELHIDTLCEAQTRLRDRVRLLELAVEEKAERDEIAASAAGGRDEGADG
jgi:hypothetical protein